MLARSPRGATRTSAVPSSSGPSFVNTATPCEDVVGGSTKSNRMRSRTPGAPLRANGPDVATTRQPTASGLPCTSTRVSGIQRGWWRGSASRSQASAAASGKVRLMATGGRADGTGQEEVGANRVAMRSRVASMAFALRLGAPVSFMARPLLLGRQSNSSVTSVPPSTGRSR